VLSVEADAAQGPGVHLPVLGGEVDRDVLVRCPRCPHLERNAAGPDLSGTLPPRTGLPKSAIGAARRSRIAR
jgi:hypothetical protein